MLAWYMLYMAPSPSVRHLQFGVLSNCLGKHHMIAQPAQVPGTGAKDIGETNCVTKYK